MKKAVLSLFACGMAAMILTSCGAKYTPMTDEQKGAKADSIYAAKAADEAKAKADACAADMQAKVDAKVKELTAAAATAEAK